MEEFGLRMEKMASRCRR